MNLMRFLPWIHQPAARPSPRPDETALPALDAEEEAVPRGCGWFDSSHDLQHGLSVREHASADALARELPLAHWLEFQLNGWRPVAGLSQPT